MRTQAVGNVGKTGANVSAFMVLAGVLDDLARAIRPLGRAEFSRRARATSGGIGSHVRHCLDHVEALERAIARGVCCYDERVRGTAVEDDPAMACARLAQLTLSYWRSLPVMPVAS